MIIKQDGDNITILCDVSELVTLANIVKSISKGSPNAY